MRNIKARITVMFCGNPKLIHNIKLKEIGHL